MENPTVLKILNRFFKFAAPTFLLLTFSFEVTTTGKVSILWRDSTMLAVVLTGMAAVMTVGWIVTSRRLRHLSPPEDTFSFVSEGKQHEAVSAPYNIFDSRMEPATRRRMALAVFLTFSIIGPISILMRSALFPIHFTAVLLLTLSSGFIAASFILFGHRKILLVLAFVSCMLVNMYVDTLTQMLVHVPPLRNSTLVADNVVLSQQEIKDIKGQRILIGVGVMALLTSGYIMWLVVLNREGNKRVRYQTEVQVAQKIQHTLLPASVVKTPWCEIGGLTVSASDVGGDYFDIISIDENKVAVVIADVAGHGIGAGILSAMTKSALRSQILHDPSPVAVLENLNATLHQVVERKMFVTLAYVLLDWKERQAHIATAGHPPVLHRSKNIVREVRTQSLGLGMQRQCTFSKVVVPCASGDILCLYTDGVTEAANKGGEQFGSERLAELVANSKECSADAMSNKIIQAVSGFVGKKEFNDDAAVVNIMMNSNDA